MPTRPRPADNDDARYAATLRHFSETQSNFIETQPHIPEGWRRTIETKKNDQLLPGRKPEAPPAPVRKDYPNDRTFRAAQVLYAIRNHCSVNYAFKDMPKTVEVCEAILAPDPKPLAYHYLNDKNYYLVNQAVAENFPTTYCLGVTEKEELFRGGTGQNI
ncbi:MAG: hypothetical protein IKO93_13320 [Lentisphaeria bacterium]|nr:hypothetical protein [Lentisphaeria bacterium]